jgi:hypothetical protein
MNLELDPTRSAALADKLAIAIGALLVAYVIVLAVVTHD